MRAYERVLRLKHLRLQGWQREALTWGLVALSVLLALAGLVSPWAIVVLPVLVAAVLKAHDLLSGRLLTGAPLLTEPPQPVEQRGTDGRGADSNEPPVARTEGSEAS